MSKEKKETSLSAGLLWSDLKLCLVFMTRLPLRLDDRTPRRSLAQACALLPLVGLVVGFCGAVVLSLTLAVGLPPPGRGGRRRDRHHPADRRVARGRPGRRRGRFRGRPRESPQAGNHARQPHRQLRGDRHRTVAHPAGRSDRRAYRAGRGAFGRLPACWSPRMLSGGDGCPPSWRPCPLRAAMAWPPPPNGPMAGAAGAGLALCLLIAAICLGPLPAIAAFLAAGIAVIIMAWLARRQIGGYTGDVLGASEQVAEITALAAITAIL